MHPKWSYVKTDAHGFVVQSAEKMPISNQAIAGLFYFKTAALFVESAKSMIRKDVKTNGSFFISPTLNEIILNEGKVKAIEIDKNTYCHVSDEHALETYEQKVLENNIKVKDIILQKTHDYAAAFNSKDIASVACFFSENFTLTDPAGTFLGKSIVANYINEIFTTNAELSFNVKSIYITSSNESIIEFELYIGEVKLVGTDVIKWNKNYQMIRMNAYLYEVNNG